jgi:hypothetical protein
LAAKKNSLKVPVDINVFFAKKEEVFFLSFSQVSCHQKSDLHSSPFIGKVNLNHKNLIHSLLRRSHRSPFSVKNISDRFL